MEIYLVDGTYELFRHYYALPSAKDTDGREVAAVRGVLASVLGMIKGGATHIAVATDHVIESFRNGLWQGYKTSEGVEPDLLAQFPLLEEVLVGGWYCGVADGGIRGGRCASCRCNHGRSRCPCRTCDHLHAGQGPCPMRAGTRIVQLNRRTRVILDEAGVVQKFGVSPASIPDYLALVGDASDGYPGLPGWGAKSSAAVLAKFVHLESIPLDSREWRVNVANASALAGTLSRERDRALLFRTLATLRTDIRSSTTWTRCAGTAPRPLSLRSRPD